MQISKSHLKVIEDSAKAAFPKEACGLLVGKDDQVLEVVPSPNLASKDDEFQIDPVLHLKTQRQARAKGLTVLGVYHSHPTGDSAPSNRDLEGVDMPGFYWLITGFDGKSAPKTALFWEKNENLTSHSRKLTKVPLQIGNFGA